MNVEWRKNCAFRSCYEARPSRGRHFPDASRHGWLRGSECPFRPPKLIRLQRSQPVFLYAKKPSMQERLKDITAKFKDRCAGCGAKLQTFSPSSVGYIVHASQPFKAPVSRNSTLELCERCKQLREGKMVPAVRDGFHDQDPGFSEYRQVLVTPDQLKLKLMVLKQKYAVVLFLVDILDVSSTLLSNIRRLVGKNPVLLVANKADLLPSGTHLDPVKQWLLRYCRLRHLQVVDCCLVSAHTGSGLRKCASVLEGMRDARDVYVVGVSNVGKSAFVRAFVEVLEDRGVAVQLPRIPMESAMPGTTLSFIPAAAFHKGGLLLDTPGVHAPSRALHLLPPEVVKMLQPTEPCNPRVAPLLPQSQKPALPEFSSAVQPEHPRVASVLAVYTLGSLMQLEVLEAVPSLALVYYGPPDLELRLHTPSTMQAQHTNNRLHVKTSQGKESSKQQGRNEAGKHSFDTLQGDINHCGIDESHSNQQGGYDDSIQRDIAEVSNDQLSVDAVKPQNRIKREGIHEEGSLDRALKEVGCRRRLQHSWCGELKLKADGRWGCLGDLAAAGLLGWISVYTAGAEGLIRIRVTSPHGVRMQMRYGMPLPYPIPAGVKHQMMHTQQRESRVKVSRSTRGIQEMRSRSERHKDNLCSKYGKDAVMAGSGDVSHLSNLSHLSNASHFTGEGSQQKMLHISRMANIGDLRGGVPGSEADLSFNVDGVQRESLRHEVAERLGVEIESKLGGRGGDAHGPAFLSTARRDAGKRQEHQPPQGLKQSNRAGVKLLNSLGRVGGRTTAWKAVEGSDMNSHDEATVGCSSFSEKNRGIHDDVSEMEIDLHSNFCEGEAQTVASTDTRSSDYHAGISSDQSTTGMAGYLPCGEHFHEDIGAQKYSQDVMQVSGQDAGSMDAGSMDAGSMDASATDGTERNAKETSHYSGGERAAEELNGGSSERGVQSNPAAISLSRVNQRNTAQARIRFKWSKCLSPAAESGRNAWTQSSSPLTPASGERESART